MAGPASVPPPIEHVLFDLNGTLVDSSAITAGVPVDDPEGLAERIFADAVLFAIAETASGSYREFTELLHASASRQLELLEVPVEADSVVAAAKTMPPFPDAGAAIERLRSAGIGTGVLTNSATESARSLLEGSGLELEPIVGTDASRAFKPDPRPYRDAIARIRTVSPASVALVTVHSWDVLGSSRAGLQPVWISRKERLPFPQDPGPRLVAGSLLEAAEQLAGA